MHFYKRGGDRRDIPGYDQFDSTWFGPTPFGVTNSSNLHPDIGDKFNADDPTTNSALDLSDADMENLVQFLLALTDERVACHAGIFDHPELPLVMGHKNKARHGTQLAEEIVAVLPAVGRRGLPAGKCFPNSGDLFDQPDLLKVINKDDPRGLQTTFRQILDPVDHGKHRRPPVFEPRSDGPTNAGSLNVEPLIVQLLKRSIGPFVAPAAANDQKVR